MAERFTGQRCQDCQGGLIYNKKEKYWECPYCGKIYERELRFNKVQIDGLAGINDLVRSTLSRLVSLDFPGAEKDLYECEKINHASVGTLIAKLSISLYKSLFTKDRQVELSKVNALLPKLNREFADIDEPEEILYDFIDSADIYGLLVIVYGMTGQTTRKNKIFELLDVDEVFDPNVSRCLINLFLKENRMEEADVLLSKMTSANSKYGLMSVLSMYPCSMKKADHVENLLGKLGGDVDVSKLFDSYFNSNNDSDEVVVAIFLKAVENKVNFNTSTVINAVLKNCTTVDMAKKTFDSLSSKRLDENTTNAIMNWAVKSCNNADISEIAFNSLAKSNSVFEITDNEIGELFNTDQDEDVKCKKLNQLLEIFKITNKSLDKVLYAHMLHNMGTKEYRKAVFDILAERVPSVQFTLIEQYVLDTDFDGEGKAELLKASLAKVRSVTIATGTFSQYLKSKVDSPEVRELVISEFLDVGLKPDPDALGYYILNGREAHSDNLVNKFISKSCKASSNTFDRYIDLLSDGKSYNQKLAELATASGYSLSVSSFQKFLLTISETENKKINHVAKHITLCATGAREVMARVNVGGEAILCNLAQAYLFVSNDDIYLMQEIIAILERERIKLDVPVELPSERKKVKMKKYVEMREGQLSAKVTTLTKQIL